MDEEMDVSGGILRRCWRLRFGFWGTRLSRVHSRGKSGFVRVDCRNRWTKLVLFEIYIISHLRHEHCCYLYSEGVDHEKNR